MIYMFIKGYEAVRVSVFPPHREPRVAESAAGGMR